MNRCDGLEKALLEGLKDFKEREEEEIEVDQYISIPESEFLQKKDEAKVSLKKLMDDYATKMGLKIADIQYNEIAPSELPDLGSCVRTSSGVVAVKCLLKGEKAKIDKCRKSL